MEVHWGHVDQADPYLCLPFRLYLAKHQGHLHQGDPYPNVFIFPQPYMHLEDGVIDHRAHNLTNISVGLCTLVEVYHIYNYDLYIIIIFRFSLSMLYCQSYQYHIITFDSKTLFFSVCRTLKEA